MFVLSEMVHGRMCRMKMVADIVFSLMIAYKKCLCITLMTILITRENTTN